MRHKTRRAATLAFLALVTGCGGDDPVSPDDPAPLLAFSMSAFQVRQNLDPSEPAVRATVRLEADAAVEPGTLDDILRLRLRSPDGETILDTVPGFREMEGDRFLESSFELDEPLPAGTYRLILHLPLYQSVHDLVLEAAIVPFPELHETGIMDGEAYVEWEAPGLSHTWSTALFRLVGEEDEPVFVADGPSGETTGEADVLRADLPLDGFELGDRFRIRMTFETEDFRLITGVDGELLPPPD